MKRYAILSIIITATLSLPSCIFEKEASNPYEYSGVRNFAENTCRFILESAVNAMEQNVDDWGAFKEGTVTVHDQRYNASLEIGRMEGADSTWVVRESLPYDNAKYGFPYSFNPNRLHYILTLRLLEETADNGLHSWNASFTGEYDEGDGYTASLKSLNDGVRMFWKKSTGNNTVQYTLNGDGRCEVDVFKDGEHIDKAYFYYRVSQ